MAITLIDHALAGMRPPEYFYKVHGTTNLTVLHSLFYDRGMPGAAVAPTPGLAGTALTSYAGQIPFTNPASGNTHLARFVVGYTQNGAMYLCDRLWHNSGFTITQTTAQTVNSVAWPARDNNGSTNGEGVMVGIEASTALGNGTVSNTTLQYTNQSGTSGRTGTINSFVSSGTIGVFVPFELQAGDTGVRSIQSLTLGTSYVSGTIHLVAFRVLACLYPVTQGEGNDSRCVGSFIDPISGGFVRLYDNTVPFLLVSDGGGSGQMYQGQIIVSQG